MPRVLRDPGASENDRILATMGLASRHRVEQRQTIDFPCIDFGPTRILLFRGESFVGYQLLAQQMLPDAFVISIGYGECWPGYIPTTQAYADNFDNVWHWVGTNSDQ